LMRATWAAVIVPALLRATQPRSLVAAAEGAETTLVAAAEEAETTQAAVAENVNIAKRLLVEADDHWPFSAPAGGPELADVKLLEAGVARNSFACAPDNLTEAEILAELETAAERLAVDGDSMSARKLILSSINPEEGVLDVFRSGWAKKPDEERLTVSDARIAIRSLGPSTSEGDVVYAELEDRLPNTSFVDVASSSESPLTPMTVLYDCRREGKAVVELRLAVRSALHYQDICIRWLKDCARGFRHLEIKQDGDLVFSQGEVDTAWKKRMTTDGTHDLSTKLVLKTSGIERLLVPKASSDQRLLWVGVLGPFLSSSDQGFELTSQPSEISVYYTCEFAGHATVTLKLEKARLSEASQSDFIELPWIKHCGNVEYKYISAFFKVDGASGNAGLEAIRDGRALPGFALPCGTGDHDSEVDCDKSAAPFLLTVPETEKRTSIDLHIDKKGSAEPPVFQPEPDISYDSRVLRAEIVRGPKISNPEKNKPRNSLHTVTVKYTCFKDGDSTIMLTLHVLAHRTVHLAWTKKCKEPKVKRGKALTAPQAMLIVFFVCSAIGIVICLIFCCCSEDDGRGVLAKEYSGMGNYWGDEDVELAEQMPPREKPIRRAVSDDDEVVFH